MNNSNRHEDILIRIEDEAEFIAFIHAITEMATNPLEYYVRLKNEIDPERAALAYRQYKLGIDHFANYLQSANPDHYKRCGALLHALCSNPVLRNLDIPYSADDVEAGYSPFTLGDTPYIVESLRFYEEYYNVFAAFELCFKICCAYENNKKNLEFDVVHNICHYLKQNHLVPDSYFMLFRLLMA
jgi:hypothetical protein